MSESPFARGFRDLLMLGYHVIPIIPPDAQHPGAGKAPGEFKRNEWVGRYQWQQYRDRAPGAYETGLWSRNWPSANIGIVLGSIVGDLKVIAVDIDTDVPLERDAILAVLPASPMRKRAAKGLTLFYRAPASIRSKSYDKHDAADGGKPRRVLDLLTGNATRQTVVPPSLHPSGVEYHWLEGPVNAVSLPVFDDDALADLEKRLAEIGCDTTGSRRAAPRHEGDEPEPARPARPARVLGQGTASGFWREINETALTKLDAWVHALDLYNLRAARGGYECVATWRPSATGRALHERKRNLSIQASGIKDFGTGEGFTAIDLVMAARGCANTDAANWLALRLGLDDGGGRIVDLIVPRMKRAQGANAPPVGTFAGADGGDDGEDDEGDARPSNALAALAPPPPSRHELPAALTNPPGLLGHIVDWITHTARRPQRGLALGAALAVLGTAAGRKYAGPTRTGTHLYVLGLARTSAGKDHPLQQIARLLTSCGLEFAVGPSQFMSMSAVVKRITREPLTLAPMDEFGNFLARINSRRASPHEQAITGLLRTAWGSSFQTIAPPEWAGQVAEPIHAPALSIFGVSTPAEFYAALQSGDVQNGFLNRFLLISTGVRPAEVDPPFDPFAVPPEIAERLRIVFNAGGALGAPIMHEGRADPPLVTAQWGDGAKDVYVEFGRWVESREADIDFLARSVEMAQRCATILAIGVDPQAPIVTQQAMEWGRDLALWSAERMKGEALDYIAESETQAEAQRIRRLLREKGPMTMRDVKRALSHKMKNREVDDLIKGMVEAGDLEAEVMNPPNGGRQTITIRLAG